MTASTEHDLLTTTLAKGRRRLLAGEVTSGQLTQAFLDRIAATDDEVRAFVTVTAESALEQAAEADALLTSGDATAPLTGLPIGLKDVLMTRGVRTTAGSRMLDSLVPPYDATVVARLREAGAISLGKLNMDEFAMGSSTEHSAWFPTANPGISNVCRADRRAVRPQPSPRVSASRRWAPIPADRFVSRPHSVASLASNRPTAVSRATA